MNITKFFHFNDICFLVVFFCSQKYCTCSSRTHMYRQSEILIKITLLVYSSALPDFVLLSYLQLNNKQWRLYQFFWFQLVQKTTDVLKHWDGDITADWAHRNIRGQNALPALDLGCTDIIYRKLIKLIHSNENRQQVNPM